MSNSDDTLRDGLGSDPPAALDCLKAADRKHLAALIQNALDRPEAVIDEAEDNVLKFLPRPLRPTVRKLLIGGR